MPNPPMLAADTADGSYEDVSEELDRRAMLEGMEPSGGPSPSDLPTPVLDDEIARAFEDLETVAELEAR